MPRSSATCENHPKLAEPWMYELLATSIEINQGSAADVKKSLNFAADLAQRTHNPNHLVSVADQLFMRGYFERVGPLLDEAMPQVPHRSEPMVMSINLAQKTKDPIRMADAIDRLLSLGWPGQDEYFRIEAANQVDALAKSLREEERGERGRRAPSQADGIAGARPVRPADLGWQRRFRPCRRRAARRDGQLPDPAHRLWRLRDQEWIRVSPRRSLRLPAGIRRRLHDSRQHDLDRPEQAGDSVDPGNDHSRRDREREEADPQPIPDKPNKPVIVTLSGGRRKLALPFVDPMAAIWAAVPPPTRQVVE